MKAATRLFGIFLCLLLVASTGHGQTTSGSISGTIVDPQHAAVSGASVTGTEVNKKFTQTVKTDAAGRFVLLQLSPGMYSLTVEAPGFKKFEQKNVELNPTERLALGDLALEVGAVTQAIEVTAAHR